MKIPELIIEKYQLTPSGEWNGDAFMHDLQTFKSPFQYAEPIRFMECNLSGQPTDYIMVYNKVSKKYLETTPEYLLDTSIEMIIAQLKSPDR